MSFNEYWQAEQRRRALADAAAVVKSGDPTAQARFLKTLPAAVLLVPVTELPEGFNRGDLIGNQKVEIRVKLVKNEEGVFLPVFTSEAQLQQCHGEGSPFLSLSFGAIVRMLMTSSTEGIVIDRGGPTSLVVRRPILLALAQTQVKAEASKGDKQAGKQLQPPLRVGPPPRVIRYAEVVKLAEWLEKQDSLAQAYLCSLIQANGQAALSVALGFTTAPDQERLKAMAKEVRAIVGVAALVMMDGSLAQALARQPGVIRFDFDRQEVTDAE